MDEVKQSGASHEVIVVGSGAGGGMMTHTLTQAGVNVLMLEAGSKYDPETETNMFGTNQEAPLRGEGTPDKGMGYYDANVGGYALPGEPYTGNFRWWRARMLGGRTNHWGRMVPRYGPDDFKMSTNTGWEIDWPVSYEDMAPYYDRVETLMGVFGPDENEAVRNSPMPPNHIRQKPPAPRASELIFEKACKELGWPVHASPTAILTEQLGDRAACFYATNCIRGCSIGAAFDSVTALIKPAQKTGKLTIVANAVVYQVEMDETGKVARGVRYIDKETGERRAVYAKVVVLAASTMETCRILLNSKTDKAPDGLGNSSGLLGKYLSDTTVTGLMLQLPALENLPPHNEDGVSQPHIYAPSRMDPETKKKEGVDFAGGFKIDVDPYFGGRFGEPSMSETIEPLLELQKGLYGKALKEHMRRYYGSIIFMRAFGYTSLSEDCRITIDPEKKDKWGVPVPKFYWKRAEADYTIATHMNKALHTLAKKMDANVLYDGLSGVSKDDFRNVPGGFVNHEVGGCRMGDDPSTSVLNKYSCSWDVPNLYVADGASFVTHPEKNPTNTIMALSMRAADNIIKRLQEDDI